MNFASRMSYHKSKGRVPVFLVGELNYVQCRGLEQAGMIFFHTINWLNPLNHKIRGVGPNNGARKIYFAAFQALWETLPLSETFNIPYEYVANWTENEFLNGFE